MMQQLQKTKTIYIMFTKLKLFTGKLKQAKTREEVLKIQTSALSTFLTTLQCG